MLVEKAWVLYRTGHLFTTSLNSSFHVGSLILTPKGTLYWWR